MEKRRVETLRLRSTKPLGDLDAVRTQGARTAPPSDFVRVTDSVEDACDACSGDGVSTRWRPPVVAARLQGDIEVSSACIASRTQRFDLSVRAATTPVVALANDTASPDENGSDHRVRGDSLPTTPRQLKRALHESFVSHVGSGTEVGRIGNNSVDLL